MPLFLGKHGIVFGKQRGFFRKHSLFFRYRFICFGKHIK